MTKTSPVPEALAQSSASPHFDEMIVYSLSCEAAHAFEGWFKDSATFEAQAGSEALACPFCGSHKIAKAPMTPALKGAKKPSLTDDEARKMRRFVTGLRLHIEEHADYVGEDFTAEARRIHYGETPYRHIYGEATGAEAAELIDEGVEVAPLPPDLSDSN